MFSQETLPKAFLRETICPSSFWNSFFHDYLFMKDAESMCWKIKQIESKRNEKGKIK